MVNQTQDVIKYGKEKLCFLLPLRRYNDEKGITCKGERGNEMGENLLAYKNALADLLCEYGIDMIDLYENGIPKPLLTTGDEYTVDGVHPNDRGYLLIANRICEYIKTNNRGLL